MIASRYDSPPRGIIALFPQLLGVGGVQEAGRLTAAALSRICRRRGWLLDSLSLNDPSGPHSFQLCEEPVRFQGFGRAKLNFVVSAGMRVWSLSHDRPPFLLAAHPNLAPVVGFLRAISSRSITAVMAHGIEVWKPLNVFRRRPLLRADLVFAPSRYTAQQLNDVQGALPERVRILPWPLNPRFLQMAAAPERLSAPPFPEGRVVLTVGRWAASERYKGADELIHAVANLCLSMPELHLMIVGDGDDVPRLKQLAATLGISDRAHFVSNLSTEQIAACYSRADVFALPSTGEGFGFVFIEAMAFAKPVIAAAYGGASDIVEDNVSGILVSPHETQELASAINRLFRDSSLRTRLGRAGAEIVQREYQFSSFEAALERIVEESGLQAGL